MVALWSCRPREPGQAALQLTVAEFEEIFTRLCKKLRFAPADLPLLRDTVAATTERCPGTVMHTLDMLGKLSPANHVHEPKRWQELCCELLGSARFLSSLAAIPSFPRCAGTMSDPDRHFNCCPAQLLLLMLS